MNDDDYDFYKPSRNPTNHYRLWDPDKVPEVRKVTCKYYNYCLSIADKNNWRGFSCRECYAYEAITSDDNKRDYEGIVNMLIASVGGNPEDFMKITHESDDEDIDLTEDSF